ncbi:hypothetical protein PENTCL1PPCAC_19497 [Pristionchus entomophagus]|uniref:Globin domain-containing protein n=1 Tax=Pristionchus entomophagus TaxID=358040 RepID=A0AAV5TT12_9BILA|nr:hypothetical protein PENTCL1PPCAC_19497 [Pristionchus entomophagus]
MEWHAFTKEEKSILLQTWNVIDPQKQMAACDIYEMIFNQCPEARKLFPRMKTSKGSKHNTEFVFQALRFMQVIESSVHAIDNLDSMNNILDNLGRRHGKLEVCGKFRSYYWSVYLECTLFQFRKYLEVSKKFNHEATDNAIIVWRTLLKEINKKIKDGYTADIAHRMSQMGVRIQDRKMSLAGVSADSAFDDEN